MSAVAEGVAVIGIAARFPGCDGIAGFWQRLFSGDAAAAPLPAHRVLSSAPPPAPLTGYFFERVDRFDAEFFGMSAHEAERADPQQRMLLEVAWDAVEDAGYRASSLAGDGFGVFVGIANCDYATLMRRNGGDADGLTFAERIASAAPARVAKLLGAGGPCEVIETACTTSLTALHRARQALALGECTTALVASTAMLIGPDSMRAFNDTGALSADGSNLVFDQDARGTVLGEGVVAVVLKPLAAARADGDAILGTIVGSALRQGARTPSLVAVDFDAIASAARAAAAGVPDASIGYVFAQGSATPAGDAREVRSALRGLGAAAAARPAVGSLKPGFGHLEASAGLGAVAAVLGALRARRIPPVPGVRRPNSHLENVAVIPVEPLPWPSEDGARHAAVTGFGYAGLHVALVLAEAPPAPPGAAPEADEPALVLLSAYDDDALARRAADLAAFLADADAHGEISLADIARTLRTGREPMRCRLAVVARSKDELRELLTSHAAERGVPDRTWEGSAEADGPLQRFGDEEEDAAYARALAAGGKLGKLAALWVAGADLNCVDGLDRGGRRVRLPVYRFEGESYWSPRVRAGASAGPAVAPLAAGAQLDATPQASSAATAREAGPDAVHAVVRRVLGRAADRRGALDRAPAEAGVDSIAALRLRSGWLEAVGVAVPVAAILGARSVAALLDDVRSQAAGCSAPASGAIVPDAAARYEPFPLAEIQLAYFLGRGSTFAMGGTDCRVYWEFDRPSWDVARLVTAWDGVVARHDMLRVVITDDGRQRITPQAPPAEIPIHDATGGDAHRAALREAFEAGGFGEPGAPPYRFAVSRGDGGDRLHVAFDLMAVDAASLFLVVTEWAQSYDDPATALPPPAAVQFRDYVLAAERRRALPAYEADLAWWKDRLDGLPPPPALPAGPPQPAPAAVRFRREAARLAAADWDALRAACARRGLSVPVVLIAAFADALAAAARSPRFTINVTVQQRLPLHPDVGSVVGDFTSGILLAVEPAAELGFASRAAGIARRIAEDLEHLEVSAAAVIGLLSQRRGSAAAMPVVFTSLLGFSAGDAPLRMDRLGRLVHGVTQTPQVSLDVQVAELGDGLLLSADAVVGAYPAELPARILAAMAERLRAIARDEAAWESVAGPARFALHEPFVERALAEPDRLAVVAPDRRIAYGELLAEVRRTAAAIRRAGGTRDVPAAVVMRKGWEQVVAALAASLAGVPYLPIDAELPPARIAALCALGGVRVAVIAGAERPAGVPDAVAVCAVAGAADATSNGSAPDAFEPVDPDGPAYVIYTSGSTGTPKGVTMRHAAVANTLAEINRRFAVGPRDRVLALSSLSFDLSVWDMFGVLGAGGAIVLPDPAGLRDPAYLAELVRREDVTLWNSVPSFLQLVLPELAAQPPAGLRDILLSGDTIPVALAVAVRDGLPSARLTSLGGATEAAIWSIAHPVGAADLTGSAIPYGRALPHQSVHVLDAALAPCAIDVAGDLYIGGAGLADGYWRDPQRTAERFVRHPVTSERLYRTGDRGSLRADGVIRFLGRSDDQVKIGGYRVELGELEAALAALPGVAESAAATLTDADGQKRLVAAVRPARGRSIDAPAALAALRERLPAYVIPARLIVLEEFPLNGNGKVDRAAIARLAGRRENVLPPPLDDEAVVRGVLGSALADPRERAAFAAAHLAAAEPDGADDLPLPPAEQVAPAATERRTHRRFTGAAAGADVAPRLAALLALLRMDVRDGTPRFRYPSAGSTYAVRAYVRLAGGDRVYRYDPAAHRLRSAGPAAGLTALHLPANQAIADAAAFELYLVADLDAVVPLYGPLGTDLALVEAGYIGQLLMDGAAEAGLGLCPIGWIRFEPLRAALGLGPSFRFVHGFCGGVPAEAAVAAAPVIAPVAAPPHPVAVAAGGPMLGAVRAIWRELLGHEHFGDDDNFFEVGGTSFSVIALQRSIEERLGISCRVTDLFLYPTAARLAAFLAPSAVEPDAVTPPAAAVVDVDELAVAAAGELAVADAPVDRRALRRRARGAEPVRAR